MRSTITVLLILATLASPLQAESSPNSWASLAQLRSNEHIELVDMSLRARQGRFAGYSQDAILIDAAGQVTAIPRNDVCMVNSLEATHRGRNTWLYLLAGAASGAAVSALGWAATDERLGRDFLKTYTLVGAASGAALGATSQSGPRRFSVYKSSCEVKYRPDLLLPVIEFYGGFSEANIQTGATPAGGFEVGRPAHARQSEPGGVFSLAIPVNEHLRKRVVPDPMKPLPPRPPREVAAPEKREGSRWSVHTLIGGGPNLVDDSGVLASKPGHELNGVLIGFKDAFVWEANVDFNVTRDFALRAGYQIANVDFGSGLLPFSTVNFVQWGTAMHHTPQLGLLFTHVEKKLSLDAGLVAGPTFYTNIKESHTATETFGIQRMTSQTGFTVGPVMDLYWNVKRTGLLLGFGVFLPIGLSKAAGIRMETAPDSEFESGVASFGPGVFALSVGYRFR